MTGKEMNKDENLISHCGLYCETNLLKNKIASNREKVIKICSDFISVWGFGK